MPSTRRSPAQVEWANISKMRSGRMASKFVRPLRTANTDTRLSKLANAQDDRGRREQVSSGGGSIPVGKGKTINYRYMTRKNPSSGTKSSTEVMVGKDTSTAKYNFTDSSPKRFVSSYVKNYYKRNGK